MILTNLITGFNPWNIARLSDRCFHRYVEDPDSFRENLPISKEATLILQRIFTLDPKVRITLHELREKIIELETFFMSEEELAASSDSLRAAAKFYQAPAHLARELHRKLAKQYAPRERYVSDDEPLVTVEIHPAADTPLESVPSLTLCSSSAETPNPSPGLTPETTTARATTGIHKSPRSAAKALEADSEDIADINVHSLADRFRIVI